jgi:hypothetical protein
MNEATTVSPDAETQNPAPVTDENAEVVTPETDSQIEKPETPEDPAAKSLKRLERRIDRVTAARYQAEAEREQARQEAAQLKARLEQFEQQGEQAPKEPQVDPLQLANEIATVREINAKSNAIARDGETKYGKDVFVGALRTVIEEAGPLFTQRGTPTAIGEAVLSADEPAALLHYLGTNPDVAAELADLTPVQAARRILRIEIEMSKPAAPKQSSAPRPITPVRASSAASGGLSDDLPIDEWAKRFRALRNS